MRLTLYRKPLGVNSFILSYGLSNMVLAESWFQLDTLQRSRGKAGSQDITDGEGVDETMAGYPQPQAA